MNPLESTDFATQLATFSGVEQQVQTNDLLRGVSDALGATGIGQLAEWVGRAPPPSARGDASLLRRGADHAVSGNPRSAPTKRRSSFATVREPLSSASPSRFPQIPWHGQA